MRVVAEPFHQEMKITIFQWNNKYILKFEQGYFEQTYKISEMDLSSEDEIHTLIQDSFLAKVLARFKSMAEDWYAMM